MKAFIFPGQGIQKAEMGRDLFFNFSKAKELLLQADDLLERSISRIMIEGSEIELSRSYNAQPAIFLYEVLLATMQDEIKPDIVAGHSFGEFAALVVNQSLTFTDALQLVQSRALIGDSFGKTIESAMAAVIGLDDKLVEESIESLVKEFGEKIFIANYNGPGQLVLSGSRLGIKEACKLFKSLGAKRAVILPIEGAFHTPLMREAELSYSESIEKVVFKTPTIPICQCANSMINYDSGVIKSNLLQHMTSSVNWTKMVHNLVNHGVTEFIEVGTDDTLQKIVRRMYPDLKITSILKSTSYKDKVRDYSL